MTTDEAHTALTAAVRTELSAAWQRGLNTAPHGVNALADTGAPASYAAIMTAVHRYIEQITQDLWERVHDQELTATETEATS